MLTEIDLDRNNKLQAEQEVQKEINKRFTRFGIQETLGLDIH